jgi:D-xylose transport system substrate-binding protein
MWSSINRWRKTGTWGVAAATLIGFAAVAGCSSGSSSAPPTSPGTSTATSTAKPIVAFLLPENVTPRWESSDAPTFKAELAKLVPGAQVDVLNALNSASTQQSQAEAELAKGAKVIVIAAVDAKAAAVIVNDAHTKGVPVIAYDRLIQNSPLAYYVSFDSVAVGKAEATWMADHTKQGARLAIIEGSPTDNNAHLVAQGIHAVLDPMFKSGARVLVAEQWTPGWDPTTAQRETEQILTKAGNKVDGVVSANDGMAGGIIAALKAQGLQNKVPTTGQDASLEGIQNVIIGAQGVTVFKDFRLQAPAAAQIAADILQGKTPANINAHVSNDQVSVPSVMLQVVPIDTASVKTLVTNGWITSQYGSLSKVCTGLPVTSICG